MAEKHSLQVEILLKKTIPVGSAGSGRVAGYFGNKAKLSPAVAGAWQ